MKSYSILRPATLLLPLILALAAPTIRADEGDDQYRFIAGLAEMDSHEMVVREATAFLKRFGNHEKKDLARYRLATAHYELAATREALPHFRSLSGLRKFEFAAEVWFRLGQCQLAEGDHATARESFDQCVATGKEYLLEYARFLSADAAFRGGDYAAAEKGYAEVLERHPRGEYVRDASSGLAWCAWKLERFDEAAKRIKRHLARYEASGDDPYAAELRVLLGESHLRDGEADKALAAFRGVKDPAQLDAATRGMAFALADLGDHGGAARTFGELLKRSPEGPFAGEAALHRGIHLLRAGQAKNALTALSHKAAGDGPEVLYWRAQAQEETGDARAALGTLDRALRARPDDELRARIQMARGDALSALGREDDAIEAYGAAGSDYSLHAAAVAALNGGDAAEAASLGEELLKRFPESEYAERTQIVVGEAWFQRKEYARTEQVLGDLDRRASDTSLRARAASRLAWCRYLLGDLEGAADRFAALVQRHGDAPEAEEALYMEGRAREEAGNSEGAIRAWRNHLRAHPNSASRPQVLAGLGRLEGLPNATGHVETLLTESPASELLPAALYDLAERASAAGEIPTAIACYEQILQKAPRNELVGPARYGLAWCLVQEGRFEEAGQRLDDLRGDFSAPTGLRSSAMELAVWAWRKAGEADKAAAAWRAFAELNPEEERLFGAAKTAALALKEAGKPREAQALLGEMLERTRTPAIAVEALVEGAYLALEAGDVDQAEAQVKVAKRRAPEHPKLAEASFFVAEARFEAGEESKAIDLYRAATASGSPVADMALYKLGFAELSQDDPGAAESALSELVTNHRESELYGEGLFLLGEARFRLGKYAAAAADLERLRKERPRHAVIPKALFRLGLAYVELERWSECDKTLTELLSKHPRFENLAEAELARGTALVALARPRAARQALARVLALDGESVLAARAHIQLGRLARSERDTEGALAEFLKVAVLFASPEEVAEALVLAGDCLEEQDKPEAARERYSEAAKEYGNTVFGAKAKSRLAGGGRSEE